MHGHHLRHEPAAISVRAESRCWRKDDPLREQNSAKNVETDRHTGYDRHEETPRHCVSATALSIWDIPD